MTRSHKFLCCLPVRLGVFVLSLVEFLATGALAGLLWYGIIEKVTTLTSAQKGAAIGLAAVSSILAIVSLSGFIGSINRSRRLVNVYSTVLNWLLGVQIALGVYAIVVLLTESKQDFLNRCIDGSTDQNVINTCNSITDIKVVAVVLIIVSWIIQLYECIIVARYVIQLQEEEVENHPMVRRPFLASAYDYDPAQNRSQEFLTQPPTAGYAYADAHNSFGTGNHPRPDQLPV